MDIDLPFCLYLNDGEYPVKFKGINGIIEVERKSRYQESEDLPFTKSGIVLGIDPLNYEIEQDRFCRVLYTKLILKGNEDLRSKFSLNHDLK